MGHTPKFTGLVVDINRCFIHQVFRISFSPAAQCSPSFSTLACILFPTDTDIFSLGRGKRVWISTLQFFVQRVFSPNSGNY